MKHNNSYEHDNDKVVLLFLYRSIFHAFEMQTAGKPSTRNSSAGSFYTIAKKVYYFHTSGSSFMNSHYNTDTKSISPPTDNPHEHTESGWIQLL
jgi:hypothetical protein